MISPLQPRRCIQARPLGPLGRPSGRETDVSSAHESRRRCGRLDRPKSGDCSVCRTKPNSAKRRCGFLEGDRVDDPHQLRRHEPIGPRQHRWHQSQPRTTYRGQPQAVDVVSLNEIVIGTIGILTWRRRSEKSKGWERRWGRRRPTGAPGPVRLQWFGRAKPGRTPTSRDTLTPNVDGTACRRLLRTGRARAGPDRGSPAEHTVGVRMPLGQTGISPSGSRSGRPPTRSSTTLHAGHVCSGVSNANWTSWVVCQALRPWPIRAHGNGKRH